MPEADDAVAYEERGDRVRVPLKVVPGASRSRLAGVLGDRWKLAVAAPPQAGAANAEVTRVIAELLGVRVAAVALVVGLSAPRKTVEVTGRPLGAVRAALRAAAAGPARGPGPARPSRP